MYAQSFPERIDSGQTALREVSGPVSEVFGSETQGSARRIPSQDPSRMYRPASADAAPIAGSAPVAPITPIAPVPVETIVELVKNAREVLAGRTYSVDQWVYSDPIGEKAAADRRLATLGIMGRAAVVQQEMVEVIEGPEQPWSRRELLVTDGDVRYRSTVLTDDGASAAYSKRKETVICDGRRVWTIPPETDGVPGEVHWRRMVRAELGLSEMADPSWLLRDYELTASGDPAAGYQAEYGGRICYEAVAVPRTRSELIPADDPCDRIELLIDVETGVLLRLARVIADRDYQIREWADFMPDVPVTDEMFTYVPNDAARVIEDSGGFGDGLAKAAAGVASLLGFGRSKG